MAAPSDVVDRADLLMRRRRTFVAARPSAPQIATSIAPPPAIEDDDLPVLTEVVSADAAGFETPSERFDSYCENGEEILLLAESGFRACVERDDLPSVGEIIDLGIKRHEHFIRKPCLVGMELRWRDGERDIENLSDETLRRMLA